MHWTVPEDFSRALEGIRGRVIQVGDVEGVPAARVILDGTDEETGWDAARLLVRLADQDAQTPWVASVAMWARQQCGGDDVALAEFLHRFVCERVAFVREPGERFQSTQLTLETGQGDCDDSSRALYALARAAGLRARFCFLVQEGQPAHVFVQIGAAGQWHNAETTLAADFGESPIDAADRLGVQTRADLRASHVVTLGALGPSLLLQQTGAAQPNYSWAVRNGDRVRMILEVSMLANTKTIAADLKNIGFATATVEDDAHALDLLQWPADWIEQNNASPAEAGRMLMFADAVYSGGVSALNRTLDFAFIRDARKVIMEGDGTTDTQASSQEPGAPAGKILTAADLPEIPPDPTDTTTERSTWLSAVLKHAWFELFPGEPYSDAIEQGILAIINVETRMGRAMWSDPIDASGYSLRWNFGNIHAGMNAIAGVCPTGSKPHGDTRWDATQNKYVPYTTCFQAYQSALDGMKAQLRVTCGKGREDTRAALATGDATKIAHAMALHGYYDAHAEPVYAKGIEDSAKVIAEKLAAPVAVARGGASGSTAGAIVAGLALLGVIGASVWAAKGG